MAYNYLFRIIILGHPAVGKTSLRRALNDEQFSPFYEPTIGIDFGIAHTQLQEGLIIKSHIWDTAGQECFSPIVRTYYRNIAGAILVFDITKRSTFERIHYWLNELKAENKTPGKIALIGNKIDLIEREVTMNEAKEFAKENNMHYFEISAKKKEGTHLFFYDFIKSIYDTINIENDSLPPGIKKQMIEDMSMEQPPNRHKECCLLYNI